FTGNVVSGTGSSFSFGTQTTTALYTVLASNTTSSCIYWLNSSVSVANLAPPGVGTPPANTLVATNGACTISVVATGDGLSYQWRKNGVNLTDGGHISGSHSPNLTISSASTADEANAASGYDVVITGSCNPPATSARVSLNLQPASNLLWVGDGASNPW